MDKKTLRKVYLEKRKFLSEAEYERRNILLYGQLVDFFNEHPFKSVHTFIPIVKNNEPDVFQFIKYLWTKKPQINTITSITDLNSTKLYHFQIHNTTTFITNEWGIPEPQDCNQFSLKDIDCVLVPMIIGTKSGHRIGYGKGYYDRFLSQCSANTKFIGINLGPLLEGEKFINQYDVPMDYMITPFERLKIN
ncbi:5-formyltetrahydrofolate cyclo-ligase [Marivirga arenosa]|uniref:5-formyltetrahydrofolate cyclo-ligase n=1 Tax=Marivirga arenosa TaxID=3059076 RepID=A0AA51N7K1_9BACT|nr:5-formyltetrahydrofolate cyclo-ligase [Marivirga sp. ABR2-2]WMN07614.1 5-formyltetrahydrofolate cyclo-ligase [Marivirga sp. ABR2-2]